MPLSEKTILVTGASQGIGQFLCLHFTRKRAHVIGVARSQSGLRKTADLVSDAGGRFEWHTADLIDVESLKTLATTLQDDNVGIDVLIHNAADVTSKSFGDTSLDEMDRLVHTNVTGPLQLTKLLLPLMADRSDPSIVTMSSLAGYKPNPAQTVYSVTKWAVNGLAQALRADLGPKGFHVLNVALSSVGTQHETAPGQVPVADFARALERAIERHEDELFLSGASKWLMRLYQLYPPLARVK